MIEHQLPSIKAKSSKYLSPQQAAAYYGISPFGTDFAEYDLLQAAGNAPAFDSSIARIFPSSDAAIRFMDFPILELLDSEASVQWLLRHFHAEGLKCPYCHGMCQESELEPNHSWGGSF